MPKPLIFPLLAAGLCLATIPVLAAAPQPVSPAGVASSACPTFSWSMTPEAGGYELVVYAVSAEGEVAGEPLVLARLPGGTSSWTAPGGSCLTAGSRYAWTLRTLGEEGSGVWSDPVLFEVAAAPSAGEVEAAMATLRRHLAEVREDESPAPELPGGEKMVGVGRALEVESSDLMIHRPGQGLTSQPDESIGSVSAASAPSLGTPSLTVDANVALGAASNLFKDGSVFLWDDTDGNTALGRLALASATGDATNNTALGREALHNTVQGGTNLQGSSNTAVGDRALWSNTTGYGNTASGRSALYSNTTGLYNVASGFYALASNTTGFGNTASGHRALRSTTGTRNTASGFLALVSNTAGALNTASGSYALRSNTTGSGNTASGFRALNNNTTGSTNTAVGHNAGFYATTGEHNIFLGSGSFGHSLDTHTIRIGGTTGTGIGQQNRTYIAGIDGITVSGSTVLVSTGGQLGVTSSSASFKEGIEELGEVSQRLAALRPVTFRYRPEVLPDGGPQVGLLAEEVAEIFPELVTRDAEGRPFGVRYDLLSVLSVAELQQQVAINRTQGEELGKQQRELAALRERLAALERGERPDPERKPWWRRLTGRDRASP